MIVVRGRNVQHIFPTMIDALLKYGVKRDSRNGPVLMFVEPVTTVYDHPAERVIYYPERDANPFFHFFESLWMLAGRDDVSFVTRYVQRMADFSDDGKTFHGAYGFRWRRHFATDQINEIIKALKKDPNDRRQVLQMWDATTDLGYQGKDAPCNTQAVFQIAVDGRLDMMVSNRSNDIIWGAYGANAVHFSVLHEYVARSIGVPLGIYRQVSANFHAYEGPLQKVAQLRGMPNPYVDGGVVPYPIMQTSKEAWDNDLEMFLACPRAIGFRDPFFRRVAAPMDRAHEAHRKGDVDGAYRAVEQVAALDWQKACREWLDRRHRS